MYQQSNNQQQLQRQGFGQTGPRQLAPVPHNRSNHVWVQPSALAGQSAEHQTAVQRVSRDLATAIQQEMRVNSAAVLSSLRSELYQMREAASNGGIMWHLFGKRAANRQVTRDVSRMRQTFDTQLQNATAKMHQAYLEAMTEAYKQQMDDLLLQQQMNRRAAMFVDMVLQILNDPRLRAMPEALYNNLVASMYQQLLVSLFDPTGASMMPAQR